MKRMTGLLVMATLAIAGCASNQRNLQQIVDSLHTNPFLTVKYGIVSVTAEPIVLDLRDPKAVITWHAPVGYNFPPADAKEAELGITKGIRFLGLLVDAKTKKPILNDDPDALKSPNLEVVPPEAGRLPFLCKGGATEITCRPNREVIVRNGFYRYAIILKQGDKEFRGDPQVTPAD